jgi:hypothetical protein
MLRFKSRSLLLPVSGVTIHQSYCNLEFSASSNMFGIKLPFKVDTAAPYVVAPLSAARAAGFDPDAIKQFGESVTLTGFAGGSVKAYLEVAHYNLNDDYQGWAKWDGLMAFADAPLKDCYAGHVGFLQFLKYNGPGGEFTLDPIANFPGAFSCSRRTRATP